MPISFEDLVVSYRRMLMAKCQERETTGWGGGMFEHCRTIIARHQEAEAAYLDQMLEERRQRTDDLKKLP